MKTEGNEMKGKAMKTKRTQYKAEFKFEVALEALKGQQTMSELSSHYQVHPTQITKWKKQLQTEGRTLFSAGQRREEQRTEAFQSALYEEIGRLKFELDWLKKKSARLS
jgi:putative transposase